MENGHRERLAGSGSAWSGHQLETVTADTKTAAARRGKGWVFMTLNMRGNMEPVHADGRFAQLARAKVQRAVEVAERHRTDILVVTETGISETGEMLVRDWVAKDNEKAADQHFGLTPYFSSATADDGSPMRNRGLMVLLSPRMKQRLAKDGKAMVPALRGRGLSMRFRDDRHGHVRVLAVYGVADSSKAPKAGEEKVGAVERLEVAEWVREQGMEARGGAESAAAEAAAAVVDIEDMDTSGEQHATTTADERAAIATAGAAGTPEPLMLIGDLNCAAEPADRFSGVDKKTHARYQRTAGDCDEGSLVTVCTDLGMVDLWRVQHPDDIAYTYTDTPLAQSGVHNAKFTGARIDSIWASTEWERQTVAAGIAPFEIKIGQSDLDHRAVGVRVEEGSILTHGGRGGNAKFVNPLDVKWNEITPAQWERYAAETGRGRGERALEELMAEVEAALEEGVRGEALRDKVQCLERLINRVCWLATEGALGEEAQGPEAVDAAGLAATDKAGRAKETAIARLKQQLLKELQLPTSSIGGGVRGYDGLTTRLVEAEEARAEGRNPTAEQAQLVQWLMRVRALAEGAQVVCPRAPFREGDEYSPREWIEWAEAVRRSDNDAHTDEEAAWEVRGKEIGRQLRQKWQGLLDGEGGNSKELWAELFPKTFAEVLGTVMGELQENGEIDESRSTDEEIRVWVEAMLYTRKVTRDKSKDTPCFDEETGGEEEAPIPGQLGRSHLLIWESLGPSEEEHDECMKTLRRAKRDDPDSGEGFKEWWTGRPLPEEWWRRDWQAAAQAAAGVKEPKVTPEERIGLLQRAAALIDAGGWKPVVEVAAQPAKNVRRPKGRYGWTGRGATHPPSTNPPSTHTAPTHTASNHTASAHTASAHTASAHTASNHTASALLSMLAAAFSFISSFSCWHWCVGSSPSTFCFGASN
jgi:hypothetical protein